MRHGPENSTCACGCALKRLGDVSEKLDYTPGVFTVERHVRGKWACAACRTLVQAPVPAAVIDKGIPTAALLAQVLVAKHADHVPLYRQEAIFGRAGLAIPRATLGAWVGQCGARLEPLAEALKAELLHCQVLHADETPVVMLAPGKCKTQRAYSHHGPRPPRVAHAAAPAGHRRRVGQRDDPHYPRGRLGGPRLPRAAREQRRGARAGGAQRLAGAVAPICGIPAPTIREVVRAFACSPAAPSTAAM